MFILHGQQINGFEAIGKLWEFCNRIEDPDEKRLAIHSMIENILECMNGDNNRVCQPGQLQRLMVGVVQGRLDGVNIDNIECNTKLDGKKSLSLFFQNPNNQEIEVAETMRAAALKFIEENPMIDADDFKKELIDYWKWKEHGLENKLRLD